MKLRRHMLLALMLSGDALRGDDLALTPDFALLRADEDYSLFADRSLSGWSHIKYLPLTADRNIWLSLGGDVRVRHEYYRNEGWSDALNDEDGYLLTRTNLHADLHVGSLRFFSQLQSSLSDGRRGGPGPIDEDRLDLQQAFVSWTENHGGEWERTEVRLGRQEVQYGSGRLISVRAGANTRKTFDGGLFRAETESSRTDVFWLSPVDTNAGTFDNDRISGTYLAGIYGTLAPLRNGFNVDAYLLATRETDKGYVGISGTEERWSLGLRPWGRIGAWDYNFEIVGQFGEFADESIRAWTVASDTGFTWDTVPWRPRLGFKANIASGDRSPDDGRRGTFNALYPKAAYFGEISQVGPANFMNLHPSLTVRPTDKLSVTVDAVFFWRHQLQDGLYGPSLRLDRAPMGSTARHIGNQFDVLAEYRLTPFVAVEASAAVFTAGRFLKETGPSETVGYVTTSLSFTF